MYLNQGRANEDKADRVSFREHTHTPLEEARLGGHTHTNTHTPTHL